MYTKSLFITSKKAVGTWSMNVFPASRRTYHGVQQTVAIRERKRRI
jgi:hypothetical protein